MSLQNPCNKHANAEIKIGRGLEFDDGMLAFGEDEHVLPPAEPFSPRRPPGEPEPAPPGEEETPSTAISAPQRRARVAKPLGLDERQGLTNAELKQWNEGYLDNMQDAVDAKLPYKLFHQAKRNAEHWVVGQGIGGVGNGLGQDHAPGPFHMFSGATLLAAVTGRELSPARTKRTRSLSPGSVAEEEERRVRARHEEGGEMGRAAEEQDLTLGAEDEGIFAGGDMVIVACFQPQTQC
jgi:hypothetical protein